MEQQQITIFLTNPEAELFKSYQQFHKTFEILCKSGAFDIKGGSFTCHLDKDGNIAKIERHDTLLDIRRQSNIIS